MYQRDPLDGRRTANWAQAAGIMTYAAWWIVAMAVVVTEAVM